MSLPSKRSLAAVLAAACILSACSLGQTEPFPQEELSPSSISEAAPQREVEQVRIPYHPEDTLNPYTCSTLQNYYAAGLLYDTLVALDTVGSPQLRLAQEITIEGASCIVKIRTDAVFSDGTEVTAQDVAYSAEAARSSSRFAAQLRSVQEITVPDRYTVVFLLGAPDQFFDRSLAFPIVKLETGELPIPMGGGRFVLDQMGSTLLRNDRYYSPVSRVKSVALMDAGSLEEQSYAVLDGSLDLMYTDLRGDANLSLGLNKRQVVLNNLVFLGLNSQSWGFSAELRGVFSGLLDRETIARRAYLGFAAAAYSPIKPSYSSGIAAEEEVNLEKQNAALDAMGYGVRDDEGWRTIGGRRFSMRLLVNSDNPSRVDAAGIAADAFAAAGIQLTVQKEPYETYRQRVAAGDYDLYLGEIRIPWNLDLLSLISPDPAVGPGCVRDEELLKTYYQVKAGQADLPVLDEALAKSMPVIPLVYRRGIICFSRDFSANIVATEQDIFYNIGDW